MLSRGIDKELANRLYGKVNTLIGRYLIDGVSLYDLKRFYRAKNNIIGIANEIQNDGERLFDNNKEYIKYMMSVVKDVIDDRISEDETNKANESKLFRYDEFVNEGLLKGKTMNDVIDVLENLSNNDRIRTCIEMCLFKYLPRNDDGVCIHDGNLDLSGFDVDEDNWITKLPDNLTVNGNLLCEYNKLEELPSKLVVNGDFYCGIGNLKSIPNDLFVSGDMDCWEQMTNVILYLTEGATVKGKFINK